MRRSLPLLRVGRLQRSPIRKLLTGNDKKVTAMRLADTETKRQRGIFLMSLLKALLEWKAHVPEIGQKKSGLFRNMMKNKDFSRG
ncbi:MAG: hypothetical protein LBU76_04560 [Azoarcus sp.]|nr:hypothetical protein [Azoarcus sp.]